MGPGWGDAGGVRARRRRVFVHVHEVHGFDETTRLDIERRNAQRLFPKLSGLPKQPKPLGRSDRTRLSPETLPRSYRCSRRPRRWRVPKAYRAAQ